MNPPQQYHHMYQNLSPQQIHQLQQQRLREQQHAQAQAQAQARAQAQAQAQSQEQQSQAQARQQEEQARAQQQQDLREKQTLQEQLQTSDTPQQSALDHFEYLVQKQKEFTDNKKARQQNLQEGMIYSEQEIERQYQAQLDLEQKQKENSILSMDDIKDTVREWMKTDDEILLLQQGIKIRKKKREVLHSQIIDFMKHHEIPHFNLSSGQLVCQESKRTESISSRFLQKCLGQWFNGDSNKASQLCDYMQSNREKKSFFRLKRAKSDD